MTQNSLENSTKLQIRFWFRFGLHILKFDWLIVNSLAI